LAKNEKFCVRTRERIVENNAPVGQIFTSSAKKLKPQITGPNQGDIQTAASNAIQRVEQKKQSAGDSWKQFLKDVDNVTS
jgi:cellobiose transport system substrate-binding protein